MLDSLFSGLRTLSAPPAAKAYRPHLQQPFQPGQAVFADWSQDRAVREGLKANVWVYRCSTMTAEAGSTVPFGVQRQDAEGQWTFDWKHPLSQVLQDWNDDFSAQECFSSGIYHLLLGGNMLAGKFPGGASVRELRLETPVNVRPIPNELGGLDRYEYFDYRGQRAYWDAADIIHVRLSDPLNPYWGLGRLQAIAREVDQDTEAGALNLARLQRGGTPDGIITDEGITDPEQRRIAQREIDESWRNAKGPFVTGAGVDWIQLGLDPKKLDAIAGRTFSMRAIVLGFGYHPALFGQDSTYANSEQAAKLKWTDAVLPLLNIMASAITRCLIPRKERTRTRIFYDTSGVEALQADLGKGITSYATAVQHGIPPNKAIKLLRLRIEDLPPGIGDVSYLDGRLVTAQSIVEPPDDGGDSGDDLPTPTPKPQDDGGDAPGAAD